MKEVDQTCLTNAQGKEFDSTANEEFTDGHQVSDSLTKLKDKGILAPILKASEERSYQDWTVLRVYAAHG